MALSDPEQHESALATLYTALSQELGQSTLVVLSAVGLPDACFQVSISCHDTQCEMMTSAELLEPTTNWPIHKGKFIESWKEQAESLRIFRKEYADLFSLLGCDCDCDSALALPIYMDGKVERWVLVLAAETAFANLDLSKLTLLANLAISSLVRSEEKRQLKKAQDWIDWELGEIARVQHLMLPEVNIEIPGIKIAFRFQAFHNAGGDYFDIMSLAPDKSSPDPHRFAAVIADVSGHGPSSAVEAAMLDAIFRTYKPTKDTGSPASVLNYINDHFFTRKSRGKFITANLFAYEPTTRRLKYSSAGHPHGYIKRACGNIEALDMSEGIPVGVLKTHTWEHHEFDIEKGDILFMYTDVVIETRDRHDREFSFHRLESVIRDSAHCPFALVKSVEQSIMDFSEHNKLSDDLTMCAIEFDH